MGQGFDDVDVDVSELGRDPDMMSSGFGNDITGRSDSFSGDVTNLYREISNELPLFYTPTKVSGTISSLGAPVKTKLDIRIPVFKRVTSGKAIKTGSEFKTPTTTKLTQEQQQILKEKIRLAREQRLVDSKLGGTRKKNNNNKRKTKRNRNRNNKRRSRKYIYS